MPTKPAASLPVWASNAVYATGGKIGSPTKVSIPAGVVADGFRPGKAYPTGAQHVNDWLKKLSGDWIAWLEGGTDQPDEDTHIVETDGDGVITIPGLDVEEHSSRAFLVTMQGDSAVQSTTLLIAPPLGGSNIIGAQIEGLGTSSSIVAIRPSGGGSALNVPPGFGGGTGPAILANGDNSAQAARLIQDGPEALELQPNGGSSDPLFLLGPRSVPSTNLADGHLNKLGGVAGFGRGDFSYYDADGADGGGSGGWLKVWGTPHGEFYLDSGSDASFGPSNSGAAQTVQTLTLDPGATTPTRPETGARVVTHWSCRLSQTAGAVGADDLIVEVFDGTSVVWRYKWDGAAIAGLGTSNGISVSGFHPRTMGAGSITYTLRAFWAGGGAAPTWTVDQARMYALGNFEEP